LIFLIAVFEGAAGLTSKMRERDNAVDAVRGPSTRTRKRPDEQLRRFGHEVKLIPSKYVKPYVKRGKNDAADTAALAFTRLRSLIPALSQAAQTGFESYFDVGWTITIR
jgi:transposase